MVRRDVKFVEKFDEVVTLAAMKERAALGDMMVTRRGARLSVQPVTKKEFDTVLKMAKS